MIYKGVYRVARGGPWNASGYYARATRRGIWHPSHRDNSARGFRLVNTP